MRQLLYTWQKKLHSARLENQRLFWLRVVVVLAVVWLFVTKRTFWNPDTLFIILLTVFFVLGQARPFIVRFMPLLALLFIYDSFRGIADDLNKHVHFSEMINADIAIFGTLPMHVLQDWWWRGIVGWLEFYFYFLYIIHFLVPVLLAVLLWKLRDTLYWRYMCALVALSFAGFVTYVAFPAAPPWMASDLGYIPYLEHISGQVWHAMGVTGFESIYKNISPNPVAAVPSLHSAYPVLTVLFLGALFGHRRVWWAWAYPASMWIGVMYLGEHYFIDAVLGGLYAAAAYFLTMRYFYVIENQQTTFKNNYHRGYAWGQSRVGRRKLAHTSSRRDT